MRKFFLNPILLLFVTALCFISSCKKENHSAVEVTALSAVSNFLTVPDNAPAILGEIAEDLKKREERHPFIDQLSKKQGLPAWSKSIVLRRGMNYTDRTSAEPTGALIPLLPDTTVNKFVNAFIAVQKVDTGFRYKLVGNGDYANYKDEPGQLRPDDALNIFLAFEKSIFHRKMFKVFDKQLFKEARNKLGALKADTTSPLIIEARSTDMMVTDTYIEGYEITFCSSNWVPGGWVTGQGSYSLVEHRTCTTFSVFFMMENDGSGSGGLGGGGQEEGGGGNPGGGGGNPGNPGGTPPVNGLQILVGPEQNTGNGYAALGQNLIDLCNRLSLGYDQVSWLANHTTERDFFYNQLILPDYDYADQIATQILVDLHRLGLQNGPFDANTYNAIKGYIPESENYTGLDPMFWRALAIEIAFLKLEHPEWSELKCYYEALKELLHYGLDIIGLVPVVGEVADFVHGTWYLITGDGTNAIISYTSMLPVYGWVAMSVKYARKVINITPYTKTALVWLVKANNKISFGNRGQLRRVLQIPVGDPRVAHHIIPWEHAEHNVVQMAAKGNDPFHMNELLNGIPHPQVGSHDIYNTKVRVALDEIEARLGTTMNFTNAKAELIILIEKIKTAIVNNPGVNLDNLTF